MVECLAAGAPTPFRRGFESCGPHVFTGPLYAAAQKQGLDQALEFWGFPETKAFPVFRKGRVFLAFRVIFCVRRISGKKKNISFRREYNTDYEAVRKGRVFLAFRVIFFCLVDFREGND